MNSDKEQFIAGYRHRGMMKILLIVLSIIGIILFIGLLSVNYYPSISLYDTYVVIWTHITGGHFDRITQPDLFWADRQIWNTGFPHILGALLAGAGLAVAGALMQSLMNNPLADSYSTGISSGACYGAVAAIIMGVSFGTLTGSSGIVLNAFIGAMIPSAIIIILAQRIRMTPATLILLGTAISYFFNSLVTYIMVTSGAEHLQDAYMWQIGNLDKLDWNGIPIMAAITIAGSAVTIFLSNKLNIMATGDSNAQSLGLDVAKFRILCLLLMAFMISAIVAYTGIIGFVGLVIPHVIRLCIGSDNRYVIPLCIAWGALLLLIADYIAMHVTNIPIGAVMCIIGSPVFFALIVFQSRRTGAIY